MTPDFSADVPRLAYWTEGGLGCVVLRLKLRGMIPQLGQLTKWPRKSANELGLACSGLVFSLLFPSLRPWRFMLTQCLSTKDQNIVTVPSTMIN